MIVGALVAVAAMVFAGATIERNEATAWDIAFRADQVAAAHSPVVWPEQ